MGSRGERTQVEEDAFQAWVYARNCLLYETDRGPALLNVGSEREPRLIPRSEAWQHSGLSHFSGGQGYPDKWGDHDTPDELGPRSVI